MYLLPQVRLVRTYGREAPCKTTRGPIRAVRASRARDVLGMPQDDGRVALLPAHLGHRDDAILAAG